MERTKILCPECFKKKLLDEGNKKDAFCDGCGTQFIMINSTTVKFK